MEVLDRTATAWAVIDGASEVLVIASGADAYEFIAEWTDRGYRVVPVTEPAA